MEQARYWMWTRTNYSSRPHLSTQIPRLIVGSSCNESWEEKAFAEDTAGLLGGCVWPPRSYSCSFCRREFRSAQALGGHMNVHRRDRARLKQSSSLSGEATEDQKHPNPCIMVGTACQPQVSPFVFGTAANPNPNSGVLASPASPRVLAPAAKKNCTEDNLFSPSFSSSITRENPKEPLLSTNKSLVDSTPLHLLIVPELNLGGENLGSKEFGLRRRRDTGVYDEEINPNKRRRTDPTPGFFLTGSSGDQQQVQSEVLNHNPAEELDLELRLGDAPKIK